MRQRLHDGQRLLARLGHRQTVGQRVLRVDPHRRAGVQTGGKTRGIRRLNPNHLQIRFQRLQHRGHPRQQPAAAHRHQYHFGVRHLLQNFKCHRPLPRDHVGMIKRMDVRQLPLLGQPRRLAPRLVI